MAIHAYIYPPAGRIVVTAADCSACCDLAFEFAAFPVVVNARKARYARSTDVLRQVSLFYIRVSIVDRGQSTNNQPPDRAVSWRGIGMASVHRVSPSQTQYVGRDIVDLFTAQMQIGHSAVRRLQEGSQSHRCGGLHTRDGRKRGRTGAGAALGGRPHQMATAAPIVCQTLACRYLAKFLSDSRPA